MFKRVIPILFLLTSLTAIASEPRQITIAGYGKNSLLPYHWFNYCTNEMEGANVQLVKWVFKNLNIQVNLASPAPTGQVNREAQSQGLKNGEIDALFAVGSGPSSTLIKVTTPIMELGFSIFYPKEMGSLKSTDQLRSLQGIFFQETKGRLTGDIVIQWAQSKQLNLTVVTDKDSFNNIIQSTDNHFLIHYKYDDKINRKPYNILENQVALKNYYFALANRAPWTEMLPLIEEKFAFAKKSGLISLLKETSFKRWVKERDSILACKQALEET